MILLIQISNELLLQALQYTARALATNSSISILKGIYISVTENEISFVTCNLSMTIRFTAPQKQGSLKILRSGNIVVPAKNFMELVRTIGSKSFTLEIVSAQVLTLKSENSVVQLNGMSQSDFPFVMPTPPIQTVKVKHELLKSAVREVIFAAAKSEERPVLTGVLLESGDHNLRFIATDGVRLGTRTICIESQHGPSAQSHAIIPAQNLLDIAKMINDDNGVAEISFGNGMYNLIQTDSK